MKFLYFFCFLGVLVSLSQATSYMDLTYDVIGDVIQDEDNYLGCYKDTAIRDLNSQNLTDKALTIRKCVEFCISANTYYAGLEAGRQCFCGDSYGRFGQYDEKNCITPCNGDSSQACGGQYFLSVYDISKLVPCKNTTCGEKAVCVNRNAEAVCECPTGTTGDPTKKCVGLPMSCGCWGDPHCHTFDKNTFDFMGRCIYDLVTTDCYNKALPNGLEPFKIRVKQAKIDGVPNADKVAFVRYVEILVEGTKYRLGTDSKVQAVDESSIRFYVNNTQRNPPYQDPFLGIQVYMSGGYLMFSSQFGLTVTWGGKSKVEVVLSSSYSGFVCGLCADGDNNSKNDFVDRNNKAVKLSINPSAKFTKFFNWGRNWRIDPSEYPVSDTSVDLDNSLCAAPLCTQNCTPVPDFVCKNEALYDISNKWCGIMRNKTGPWARCIELINPVQLSGAILGCVFDMCALEGNETQGAYRCAAYETFTSQCYDTFNTYKEKTIINWRGATNCPRPCKDNQVYDVRAQCPRSCLFPQGNPDCGVLKPIEGCYCKDGYILDSNQNCIKESDCGCILPDNSTTLPPGGKLVSIDCRVIYSCNGPLQNVTTENITPCSPNGHCLVENDTPKCLCNEGYQGNGYLCLPIPPPVKNCTQTKCGEGAVCNVIRGVETCLCPNGTLGDPKFGKCIPPPMSCGCWGDPHCHTFDKSSFDFMGRCIYDMISTDCYNKELPQGLEQFRVRIKQEKRENVPNANNVAFIRYIEVIVSNNTFRLETVSPTEVITKGMERLYVNRVLKKPPYQNKNLGINVYISGGYLRFTTKFGLSITWGGKSQAEILLSSSYSGYVCGLCGNGDGVSTNDFVDRHGASVPLIGDRFTKYFNWGSSWKIPANEFPPNDNSIDLNNQKCVDAPMLCKDPECIPPIRCEDPELYENNDYWCGIMKNKVGPWAACIDLIDKSQLEGLINGCVFDMCALEGNRTIQEEYRCIAYSTFTAQCYDIFNSNDIGSVIEWRQFTNCPTPCRDNEVYDVRAQCPRSCLFPQGNPDCGVLDPIEGCYCKPGYVLDSNQNCIKESECGCIVDQNPERFILEIGEKIINDDCTSVTTCILNETAPVLTSTSLTPCSTNAMCLINKNNDPKCECLQGYVGDGYTCKLIQVPTQKPIVNLIYPNITAPTPSLCNGYQEFCTLYGDPHYITTSQFKFNMIDNCTYLIATDDCNDNEPKAYEIFASHQYRYNRTDISYFKKVTIQMHSSVIEINDDLTLDGKPLKLPYVAPDGLTEVKQKGSFIEIRTLGFLLKYYPGEILKFYPCSASVKPFCGLCALNDANEVNQYRQTDVQCVPSEAIVV